MRESNTYILTGMIRSGKTSSLLQCCTGRKDCYGILTPVVEGKRIFLNVNTKEQFAMEVMEGEKDIIAVGKYTFSKINFNKAIQIIRNAIDKKGWLVIDEIGPLELRGEGFCDVLKEVLAQRNERMIMVVREGMAEKIKEQFNISTTKIINVNDLVGII